MNAAHLPLVRRHLRRYFEQTRSPVVEFMKARTADPFRTLIAAILSARTKDETTTEVFHRLSSVVKAPDDLRRLSLARLEKLIYPVGFYRTKARHLKALPTVLEEQFEGRIPEDIEGLVQLPGVGRKVANLVVTESFDKPGICVDIHVHRISNRLGLVSTRSPDQTERALREALPPRYWKTWNRYLVAFGQTLCLPRYPRCDACPIREWCDRVNVTPRRRSP
jgi:endonuclease III